jgi:hypothetical protein
MYDRQPSWRQQIFFSIALICTTSRRIPASAGMNQEPETGGLIPV